MYCSNCGSLIPNEAKFCSTCGSKVDGTIQPNVVPKAANTVNLVEGNNQSLPILIFSIGMVLCMLFMPLFSTNLFNSFYLYNKEYSYSFFGGEYSNQEYVDTLCIFSIVAFIAITILLVLVVVKYFNNKLDAAYKMSLVALIVFIAHDLFVWTMLSEMTTHYDEYTSVPTIGNFLMLICGVGLFLTLYTRKKQKQD